MEAQIDTAELTLEAMEVADLDEVLEIEADCFSNPWSRRAFKRELTRNRYADYLLVRKKNQILGYLGAWLVLDEAHITTLAVAPAYRRQGVARFLLETAWDRFLNFNIKQVTLEVRVTNTAAQNLYLDYGFQKIGIKEEYYQDNQEDAVIMWKRIAE